MFDRKAYKEIAKKQLKGRWLTPVLITLFVIVLTDIMLIPEYSRIAKLYGQIDDLSYDLSLYELLAGGGLGRFALLLTVIQLALTGVISLAESRFYVALSRTNRNLTFTQFIQGFSHWLNGALGMLWNTLWTFLWCLLFYIPGIVKSFAYSQMFFILAEHPQVGVRKAMKLSMAMTKGYKGDLFIMSLSFIGWILLDALTFGILSIWLVPYMNMSYTNAYHALKAQALKTGVLTADDFGPAAPDLPGTAQETQAEVPPEDGGDAAVPVQDDTQE